MWSPFHCRMRDSSIENVSRRSQASVACGERFCVTCRARCRFPQRMSKTKRRSPASPPAAPPAPAWLPIAGLALLTLAMFGDVLFAGGTRVVGMEGTDLYSQFVPWRDFGFRQLREGNLALWNPHIYCGAPYFGGMQAALLYPPNWIFLILSLATAINWSIALHVFLLGALMFAWLR